MSFKENIKTKIKLDRLLQKLVSTIREPPGRWWLNKDLTRKLFDMTDFEYRKVGSLHLYIRPLEGEIMEIVVFDNELPMYRTTVADVAMRKSPNWQEMFSIRNIRKIMNDHDVIISKGKASLKRLHANALAQLDLTYTRDDIAMLLEDVRRALEQKSLAQIQESFDLFFGLLDFEPVFLGVPEMGFQIFARPMVNGGVAPGLENLILFDEESLSLGLKKGPFSQQTGSDVGWLMQYARGEKTADLQGMDVFEFLAELALDETKVRNRKNNCRSRRKVYLSQLPDPY